MFIPLDKILERDGRTDRRSDRHTDILWLLQWSAFRAMQTRCKSYKSKLDLLTKERLRHQNYTEVGCVCNGYFLVHGQ